MKQEEKFISIDYDTWNNKYKPMEEENERLRKELEAKEVTITFTAGSIELRLMKQSPRLPVLEEVGYINAEGSFIKNDLYESILPQVLREAEIDLNLKRREKHGENIIFNKYQANYYLKKIENEYNRYVKELKSKEELIDKNNDLYKAEKEKAEKIWLNNAQKIESLPWFVRWILGLKKIDLNLK